MMSQGLEDNGQVLELRKYPNRRYYDATRSRHVTLEEMRGLVREGYEIRVTDSKSGADITGKVLTQIILELDSPKLDIFPVPMLHRLIRANEVLINDFMQKYFNQVLMAFLNPQRQFEQVLRQAALQLQGARPVVPDWTKFMLAPFGAMPAASTEAEAAPIAPMGEDGALQEKLDTLQRQLVELQMAVVQGKKPPRRKADPPGSAQ